MTEYFDAATREISERIKAHEGDSNAQLSAAEMVEERVRVDVEALIADRQFPASFRVRCQLALGYRVAHESGRGRTYVKTMKCSEMLGKLHSIFHELAALRLRVRWGLLSDDPGGMVRAREKHDRRPGTGDGYKL